MKVRALVDTSIWKGTLHEIKKDTVFQVKLILYENNLDKIITLYGPVQIRVSIEVFNTFFEIIKE